MIQDYGVIYFLNDSSCADNVQGRTGDAEDVQKPPIEYLFI